MRLKAEQRRLYDLLSARARCFVRVCDDDTALWVSDFPRKYADCAEMVKQLNEEGFSVRASSGIWYMDWTAGRWQELLETLPCEAPAFPASEELHEIYALCRLLLAHPATFVPEHLSVLRRAVKLTAEPPERMKKAVRPFCEETAVRLREGKTLAHAAGRVLSAWLNQQINRRETQL